MIAHRRANTGPRRSYGAGTEHEIQDILHSRQLQERNKRVRIRTSAYEMGQHTRSPEALRVGFPATPGQQAICEKQRPRCPVVSCSLATATMIHDRRWLVSRHTLDLCVYFTDGLGRPDTERFTNLTCTGWMLSTRGCFVQWWDHPETSHGMTRGMKFCSERLP